MPTFFREIGKGSPSSHIYISIFILIFLIFGFFTYPNIIPIYLASFIIVAPFLIYEKKLLRKNANGYANYVNFSTEEKKRKFKELYLPFIIIVIIFLFIDLIFDLEVLWTHLALVIVFVPEQLEIHRIIKRQLGEEVHFNFTKTTISAIIFTVGFIVVLGVLRSIF